VCKFSGLKVIHRKEICVALGGPARYTSAGGKVPSVGKPDSCLLALETPVTRVDFLKIPCSPLPPGREEAWGVCQS
jgi:hypothetical protein